MTKDEAIKYLQQIYPNGGHCWLDEQRIEAISMAINALQEVPAPKVFEDMLNAKTAAESLGISPEEYDKIVDECLYGKEPELVDEDDLPNKEEEPVKIDRQVSKMADEFAEREYETDGYERQWLSKGYYHGYMDANKGKLKEPVSEDLKEAAIMHYKDVMEYKAKTGLKPAYMTSFKAGAKWQKAKDESCSMELGGYINELSKQFPEVSFAKLSRIAVRVAKWQKEQFEKNRLKHCNSITNEQAELEQDFIDQHLDKYNRIPTFLDAIEYGMMLQKEQMMAEAVDVEVKVDAGGYPYIPQMELYDYDKDVPLAKAGEKYKVVLIKED